MMETIKPIIMPPRFSAVRDSNKSAPLPASSPTLSPTLSAIAAGFLGSSSGKFSSTFPTRSAPTSADFVNIPPPNWANSAASEAPNPNPAKTPGSPNAAYRSDSPNRLMLMTTRPSAPPPSVATFSASYVDFSAAAVDLTFALVAE